MFIRGQVHSFDSCIDEADAILQPMVLTIPIPADVEELLKKSINGDLSVYARQALGVDLYRNRKLTHRQLGTLLGLSRFEVDQVIKNHDGYDDLSEAQLREQVDVSARIRRGSAST